MVHITILYFLHNTSEKYQDGISNNIIHIENIDCNNKTSVKDNQFSWKNKTIIGIININHSKAVIIYNFQIFDDILFFIPFFVKHIL